MPKITVVKCGGGAGVEPAEVCRDVRWLYGTGESVVLVHGGSADIDALAGRLGAGRSRLRGAGGGTSRYTDAATLEAVQLALAGAVKPRLLRHLAALSVPAVGLTGLDCGLIRARRRDAVRAIVDGRPMVVRDDHSGRITAVHSRAVDVLLAHRIVPVLSPPALGEDNHPVNVDADRVAAAVAIALRADRLVLLTGAPGVLRDPADEASLIAEYPAGPDAPATLAGGMAVKVRAGRHALEAGIPTVHIADGRCPRPIRRAFDGGGTVLRLAASTAGARP